MANFFQGRAWEEFQHRLGRETLSGAGEGWSWRGRMMRDRVGPWVYVAHGPVAASTAAFDAAITDLTSTAKHAGAYRALVEPAPPVTAEDAAERFPRRVPGYRWARTQVFDLRQDEDALLMAMNKSRRNEHRSAPKKGIELTSGTSREEFDTCIRMVRAAGDSQGFELHDDEYFDAFFAQFVSSGSARVYSGLVEGVVEATALCVDDDDTRYYLYAARRQVGTKLPVAAPLVVRMMFDAKAKGLTTFDLFGLSDDDEVRDGTSGYTDFKKTFGGETVATAGTWEFPLRPLKYRLRQALSRG